MVNLFVGIKSLRRKGFVFLVLFLIIGISMFISINNAAYNLEKLAKSAWNDYVGNLRITGKFTDDFIERMKERVFDIRGILTVPVSMLYKNKTYSTLIVYPSENSSLMDYIIKKGSLKEAVLINNESIKIGEKVKIKFGNFEKEIEITGYGSAFYVFGIVDYRIIINKEIVKEIFKEIKYNIVFIKLKENQKIEKIKLDIEKISKETNSDLESLIILDPETFPGKNETEAARRTFNIFLFLILLILSLSMFIYQLVYLEINIKELAIMNIIGFTKKGLFIFYSIPLLIIALIGIIIGSLISIPISYYFFNSAVKSIPLGFSEIFLLKYKYEFNYLILITNVAIFILIFSLFLFSILIYIKRKNIKELISVYKFVKKFQSIKKINVKFKLSLQLIAGKLWKFIILILLFSLIISSVTSLNSIRNSWDDSIKEINNFYDYFVYAKGNTSKIPEHKNLSVWKAVFHFAKVKDKDVTVATIVKNEGVMPNLIEGKWPKNKGEALISLTLSKTENIKLGEEIILFTGIKKYKFKVIGIASIPLFFLYTRETRSVILIYEDFKEIFGENDDNVIFLKGKFESFVKELKNKGFTVYLRSNEESINFGQQGGRIAFVFLNILFISLLLTTTLLIGILVASDLSSRMKEIGLLMLIGFRKKDVIFLIFSSLIIISLISLPISYFLTKYLIDWNLSEIIPFTGYFIAKFNLIDLFLSLIYVFIPIILVILISYRILKKIKIQEMLLKF